MPTADVVHETALSLARSGAELEDAMSQLRESSAGKRVSVVLAHQRTLKELEASPGDPVVTRAAALIHELLERLPSA